MLTRRTNILFDEELWKRLERISQKRNMSIGEIVRNAVRKAYVEEEKIDQIREATEAISRFRKSYGEKLAKGEDSTLLIRKMREQRYSNAR